MTTKKEFATQLKNYAKFLRKNISAEDGQWAVKGFSDVFRNAYTISSDTRIVSKILQGWRQFANSP